MKLESRWMERAFHGGITLACIALGIGIIADAALPEMAPQEPELLTRIVVRFANPACLTIRDEVLDVRLGGPTIATVAGQEYDLNEHALHVTEIGGVWVSLCGRSLMARLEPPVKGIWDGEPFDSAFAVHLTTHIPQLAPPELVGDLDADNDVDLIDFSIFVQNFTGPEAP